jgi:hypothetical protein
MCLARLRVTPLHPATRLLPCPDNHQGEPISFCFDLAAAGLARWSIPWLALLLAFATFVPSASAQPTAVLELTNSVWRYNDSGQDLGTNWRNRNYGAENQWPTGTGLFGVEGTKPYPYPVPVHTPLVLGARRVTYYFRAHFNFSGSTAGLNLIANAYVDDGAVFYLNGAEAGRVRLTNDPVYFTNKAQLATPEGVVSVLSLPTAGLVQGDNVLAVEVHQSDPNSSDVVYGMNLEIIGSVEPTITTEPSDFTVTQEGTNTLQVVAQGFPAVAYQWYRDDIPIPGANQASLDLFNYPADAGNYHVVITNSAGSATSRTAIVTVILAAPVITTPGEPADQDVLQDGTTTLSILANGFPTPTYQWYRNGAAVPGATQSSIFLFNFPTDAGRYHVVVSNAGGTVFSRTNVVAYFPDTNAPAILYVLGRPDPSDIVVVFSEPVNQDDAQDSFNWRLVSSEDGSELTLFDGTLVGGTTLYLTSQSPRISGHRYSLRLEFELKDLYNNTLFAPVSVPIALFQTPLIALTNTAWRYDQSGIDLGTNWFAPEYDDTNWSTGFGPFDAWRVFNSPSTCRDFLPGTGDQVNTCLTLSNATDTAQIPTSYFRTHFHFTGDPKYSVLRLRQIVNDGVVYHLNGVELLRQRIPLGRVTYDTLATIPAGDAGYETFEVYAPSLVQGDNALAVELHQVSLDSQDLTFGLELIGILPEESVVQPEVTVTLNGGNLEVRWLPAVGTLLSTDDLNGSWTPVTVSDPPNLHITPVSDPKRFFQVVVP